MTHTAELTAMESNILIADFMNALSFEYRGNTWYFLTGDFSCLDTDLPYNSSWQWLMSVIEKIDQLGASVLIGRFFCEIKYIDPLNSEKHFEVRIASGVKINAVNGAVLEFIKWHNANQ